MSNAREALIQVLFPLFYEVTGFYSRKSCSSYVMKHDLEHGLFPNTDTRYGGFYFSNSETISALVAMGIPHKVGHPNFKFNVKDKFPMTWVRNRNPTVRPKYESKKKWEAYLHARKEMDALLAEMGTEPNLFQRVTEQVGHDGVPLREIPACLTRRLTASAASGSQQRPQSSPARSSPPASQSPSASHTSP